MSGQPQAQPKYLGRYELMYLLGQGGMGEVHLAKLTGAAGFEKLCIVKTILPQMATDKQFVDRFRHEATVLLQLNHSNIAQVYDMGEVDQTLYMAIEYIPGVDLARVEERCRSLDTQMPVPIAVMIGQQMCEALGYAHRKMAGDGTALALVHRDVSPQNVMVSYEGVVKVIDFGLAKSSARSKATLPSTVLGKLGYMSPEQAKGVPLDHRSDIYSAGIVVWELLAGRPLFQGGTVGEMVAQMAFPKIPPLRELRPEVSETLEAAVNRALATEPGQRYARADDFSRALNELLVRENMRVSAEDVGNYVRSMCPEEYSAERALQSRLSSGLRRQTQPAPLPAELAGTAIRQSSPRATDVPHAAAPPPRSGSTAPMTAAQKALSSVGVAPPGRRVSTGPAPQVATPSPPTEQYAEPAPLTTGELKLAKSRAPMVLLVLVLVAGALGGGGWFAWQHLSPQPEVKKLEVVAPPPEKKEEEVAKAEPSKTEEPAKTEEPKAEEITYEKIEVKGDVFKVIRDEGKLYVQPGARGKVRPGEEFKLVGSPIGGTEVREFYGVASVMDMQGPMGKLALEDDSVKLPDGTLFAARELTPRAQRKAARVMAKGEATDTQKLGDDDAAPAKTEPAKTEPAKTEVAKTEPAAASAEKTEPAKTEAPPEEAKADTGKPLHGSVEQGWRGVTINNDDDFAWHGCEIRLPTMSFYKYGGDDEIEAHNNDRVAPQKWRNDRRPLDQYLASGKWAAVYCKEGKAYLKFSR